MECIICGKETNKIFKIEVENNIIEVCENCKSYGKIASIELKTNKLRISKNLKEKNFEDFEIVENYDEIIRNRRKELNLSIDELAKKVGIKESYLSKIEKGKIYPDKKTIEKLEKMLKINLREEEKVLTIKKNNNTEEEKLTIADIVEIK